MVEMSDVANNGSRPYAVQCAIDELFVEQVDGSMLVMDACVYLNADINARSENENDATAMIYAVRRRKNMCVKYLLALGVCTSARDNHGRTALDYATSRERLTPEVTEMLRCASSASDRCVELRLMN
jgi:hypothetical protein